jgi:hypothetical protein
MRALTPGVSPGAPALEWGDAPDVSIGRLAMKSSFGCLSSVSFC